jgi:hypothetical protein
MFLIMKYLYRFKADIEKLNLSIPFFRFLLKKLTSCFSANEKLIYSCSRKRAATRHAMHTRSILY